MHLNRKQNRRALVAASAAAAALMMWGGAKAHGQAFTFTGANLTYTENFNSMGATGTTFVTGWTSTDTSMVADTGSSATGSIYNYGSSGSGDRAFGSLGATVVPVFGASFLNSTGSTISQIDFSAFMEQWRSGSSNTTTEVLPFQFSLDATSLTTGTWTALTTMDLVEKLTTTTSAAAVDGNANKTSISGSALSLSWTTGTTLWIRWSDTNDSGSDGGYAVDDFNMTVTTAGPPVGPTILYFDTNGTTAGTGGSGVWDNATTNWSSVASGSPATSNAYVNNIPIVFDGTGGNVTVDAGGVSFSGATLSINSSGYVISGGSVALGAATNLYAATGVTSTIASVLAGSNSLTKRGEGTIVLAGSSTYSGGTSVLEGTLALGVNDALATSAPVNVNGATAVLDVGSTTQTFGALTLVAGQILGSGTITATNYALQSGTISAGLAGSSALSKSTAGSLVLSGTNTYSGGTFIAGGTVSYLSDTALPTGSNVSISSSGIFSVGSQSLTGGAITLASGQITGSGGSLTGTSFTAGTGSISGVSLQGSGATFTKTSSGSVVLSGTHGYSGLTSIASGGTLVFTGTLSASSVQNDGNFRTGSVANIGGTVSIGATGTLNPGGTGSTGTITSGAMSFASGSILNFDLGPTQDLIDLGANTLTVSGTSTINYAGASIVAGQTYTLFQAGGFSGVDFTTGTKPGGLGTATYNWTGSAYTVSFASVPKGIGSNPYSWAAHDAGYFQNFDTLASTGTADHSTLPTGWTVVETGTSADTTYGTNNGTSNTGNSYSFGATDSTERALGNVRSGSVVTLMGFNLRNDTATPITEIKMQYTGEQWRLGATGRNDRLDFQYSLIAAAITEGSVADGTWIDFDALDFVAPKSGDTAGALDGNDLANQVLIQGLISGLNIAPGDGIWFRWVDADATGSDDGLAIDNVSFTPEPGSLSLLALGGMGLLRRRRRRETV